MHEVLQLLLDRIETPIGEMLLVADGDGSLRAVDWTDHEDRMTRLLRLHYGNGGFRITPERNPHGLADAMTRYFAGDLGVIEKLPVATAGTSFQRDVWRALRTIRCGEPISYAQLAERIGRPKAVRAILGQQVSVAAARKLGGRLVALHGKPVSREFAEHPGLSHVFPSAARLAAAQRIELGMPDARRFSLKAMAEASSADPSLFRPFGTIEEAILRLRGIRGVGEWTAQYIALRALRETDAFPASDIGLLRGAEIVDGVRATSARLLDRAELWRPWRAYAAQHLWTVAANGIVDEKSASAHA